MTTMTDTTNTTLPASNKFEVGRTYATRSACNHDCIYQFTVVRRTAKFIFLQGRHPGDQVERRGVYTYDNGPEMCKPHGRHSMAPTLQANEDDIIEGGIRHEVEAKARRAAQAPAPAPVARPATQEELEAAPAPDYRYQDGAPTPMNQEAREAFRLLEAKWGRRAMVENGVAWCMAEAEALLNRSRFAVVA